MMGDVYSVPRRGTYTQCSSSYPNDSHIGYSFIYVHTTCLNLSEALSGHYPFELSHRLPSLRSLSLGLLKSVPLRGTVRVSLICLSPRLHSLRSLSLGLLKSQPLRGCEVSIQRVVSGGCRARLGRVRGRPQTSSYLNYYGRPLTLPSRTPTSGLN